MDIISFNEASTANSRIEKINANPDSNSGIVTQPSVIASGETVTVPTGRTAVLPNLQIDGELTIDGEVFVPSGATIGDLEDQIALKADQATTYTKTEVDDITDTKITLTEANSYDLGVGQTWQDVTASRSAGVTYTNTTGKPIQVGIVAGDVDGATSRLTIIVDGLSMYLGIDDGTTARISVNGFCIIPNGSTYSASITSDDNILNWFELR